MIFMMKIMIMIVMMMIKIISIINRWKMKRFSFSKDAVQVLVQVKYWRVSFCSQDHIQIATFEKEVQHAHVQHNGI